MFQYLEGVETIHVSSKDPEELTAKLVGTLLKWLIRNTGLLLKDLNIFLSK